MEWTDPTIGTVSTGDIGKSSDWNIFIRDNQNYLKDKTDSLYTSSRVSPSRAFDTVYQNTSGKIRMAVVSVHIGGASEGATMQIGISTAALTGVAEIALDNAILRTMDIMGIVPPNEYYKLVKVGANSAIMNWTEYDLH